MIIRKTSRIISSQKPKIKCLPLLNNYKKVVDICLLDKLNSIPLLQPFIDKSEINNVLNCLQTGWLSSKGVYVKNLKISLPNSWEGDTQYLLLMGLQLSNLGWHPRNR